GVDAERERGGMRRDRPRTVTERTEDVDPVLAVALADRSRTRRQAPHRVAELLESEAALDGHVGGIVRAEAPGREARLVEHERRHERLEHASAPRRHVARATPLVPAADER